MKNLIVIVTSLVGSTLAAQTTTWNESDVAKPDDQFLDVADAGRFLTDYQTVSGTGSLDAINGGFYFFSLDAHVIQPHIPFVPDVDLYQINITDSENFSATAANNIPYIDSIQLTLFDSNGIPVYHNNLFSENTGEPDSEYPATLPAGDPLGPTTNGIYYLAVSNDRTEPVDVDGNFLFTQRPSFSDTFVDYPIVEEPLWDWDYGSGPFDEFDYIFNYTINLTGTSFVPEPSTYVMILGSLALGYVMIFRRKG